MALPIYLSLGSYLRACRAAVRPSDLALFDDGRRRRVPGLRREELAAAANVSIDYLTEIEQGRRRHVSRPVLAALAQALRLSGDQREYLFAIAHPESAPTGTAESPADVPAHVGALLNGLSSVPAVVLNHRWDVMSWNGCAAALLADFDAIPAGHRNLVRMVFLSREYRQLFGTNWETWAREAVSTIRWEAAHHPDDCALDALIREMHDRSEDFSAWWREQTVSAAKPRRKVFHHPAAGSIAMDVQPFAVLGRPELSLRTYTAAPDPASQRALRSLTRVVPAAPG
ncbi:helix-turn-helix domain-containing protein [Actinoplanes sp. TBRC 11911]|uniref:MmyB family transcriptional regulator n=1 Tax=Actinoplanes sp. TBRC 11911 TaxID=2729386 RepID=UPI00145DACB4|nr:helix-turn-helix domain-containing protein [Actinoplanes sp. TBRC 11911]NMO56719.1 helix-turn-helix domain-containing protein [Actinoplanes sp. TBRC 11911]